jgi:hypothetical protein
MRTASRIIGTLLIAAGLGLIAIFVYVGFSEGWSGTSWFAAAFFLGGGAALMFVGRRYLILDPDAEEDAKPATKATEFLVAHRGRLQVLAQTGFALSIIRAGLACFGSNWPGRWADFALAVGVVVLFSIGRKMTSPAVAGNRDWERVPSWIRKSLPRIWGTALWIVVLLMALQLPSKSEVYQLFIRVLFLIGVAMFYAVEALYFTYGELRSSTNEELSAH